MDLTVLVLAAGEGTRMNSATPKVLHPVVGRPMIEHVLSAVETLRPRDIGVVVGAAREKITGYLQGGKWSKVSFIVQETPRGSGHAVMQATSWLQRRKGTLLVVYGDTPLLAPETLKSLLAEHRRRKSASTFLTMDITDPTGYGRVVTDADGQIERIVEHRDASESERGITVVNSGVACWEIASLLRVLKELRPNNVKKEYYLTDAAALLRARGEAVRGFLTQDPSETHGVNNRVDLAKAEQIWRDRLLTRWMIGGVTVVDPATTYIEVDVTIGRDTVIWPGCVLRGQTTIGENCQIGPYTIVEDGRIDNEAHVGPFARIRPNSIVEQGARVGNFVELKKTRLGRGSKVNHLSYVGDTTVGVGANIGAGTITCNYDGYSKFATRIDDEVFVGSNTNLVAPVHLGKGSVVGAGSTITKDVPAGALAIARGRQTVIEGWAASRRAQKKSVPSKGKTKGSR